MFASPFLDNVSTDLKTVYGFGTGDSSASFSTVYAILYCFASWAQKRGSSGLPSSTHINKWLFSDCCHVQVAHVSKYELGCFTAPTLGVGSLQS